MRLGFAAITLVIAGHAEGRIETIRWQAPPSEAGGSVGFQIHYGTRSGEYAQTLDVGSPAPGSDGVHRHDLAIPDADSIFVAMTSYEDSLHSGYSNEVFREGSVVPAMIDVTRAAGLHDPRVGLPGTPHADAAVRMTGGAAAGDYDADGWVDLFVTRWDTTDRLFRNRGDGTFEDVSVAAGLVHDLPSNGAAWGDIDNDGDLDLYVTTTGPGAKRFYLYVNDGAGHFVEEAVARGAAVAEAGDRYGQSVAFGDFDGDGWIDIHTTEWWPGDRLEGQATSGARLLRNRGSEAPGSFEDVTETAGVGLFGPSGVAAFTSRFADLDGDGWLDLLVAGDGGTSRLFWNQGNGSFVDGTASAGVGTDENGTGSAVGDFDGDGRLDWFVSGIHHPEDPCNTSELPCGFGGSGNRLYLGTGDRHFADATDAAGVREGFWGTGAVLYDIDNDGDLDLAMTNGLHTPPPEDPLHLAFQHFESDPVRMWLQNPAGVAEERSLEIGVTNRGVGRGILTFDYDRDGDLDLFLVNHLDTPVLYRNDLPAGNSWLRVATVGIDSNRAGLGAVVRVWETAEADPQVREIEAGSHYLGQSESMAHFGLGGRSEPLDRVEVYWPATGRTTVLRDVLRNQEIVANEPAPDGGGHEELLPPTAEGASGGGTACGLVGIEPLVLWLFQALRRPVLRRIALRALA